MTIEIPDETLKHAEMDEHQFKIEVACFLFEKGIMSSGKAARFCGMPRIEFWEELGKRKISRYTVEMLEEDIKNLKELGLYDRSK
jgi:predicted HTH domain antitoxin